MTTTIGVLGVMPGVSGRARARERLLLRQHRVRADHAGMLLEAPPARLVPLDAPCAGCGHTIRFTGGWCCSQTWHEHACLNDHRLIAHGRHLR